MGQYWPHKCSAQAQIIRPSIPKHKFKTLHLEENKLIKRLIPIFGNNIAKQEICKQFFWRLVIFYQEHVTRKCNKARKKLIKKYRNCYTLYVQSLSFESESDVTYSQVWWPLLGIRALHLTHPSAHTHSVNPEQWAAIYAAVLGKQLGVRYLAQGDLTLKTRTLNLSITSLPL